MYKRYLLCAGAVEYLASVTETEQTGYAPKDLENSLSALNPLELDENDILLKMALLIVNYDAEEVKIPLFHYCKQEIEMKQNEMQDLAVSMLDKLQQQKLKKMNVEGMDRALHIINYFCKDINFCKDSIYKEVLDMEDVSALKYMTKFYGYDYKEVLNNSEKMKAFCEVMSQDKHRLYCLKSQVLHILLARGSAEIVEKQSVYGIPMNLVKFGKGHYHTFARKDPDWKETSKYKKQKQNKLVKISKSDYLEAIDILTRYIDLHPEELETFEEFQEFDPWKK